MTANRRSFVLCGVMTVVLAAASGCAPKSTGPAPPVVGAKKLADPDARAKYANTYWQRHDVPVLRPYNYERVAITEFAVEFVTKKVEQSKTLQPVYPVILLNSLPDELYTMFVDELKSRDLTVVAKNSVVGSRAYLRFKVNRSMESIKVSNAADAASDTGRTKELDIFSTGTLGVIDSAASGDIESAEKELLEDLGADVSLRVRIRVGIFNGHASIERGSVVWVLSRDVAGSIVSNHSLVSDVQVVDNEKDPFMKGRVVHVSPSRYLTAMRELFPALIGMAFLSDESGQAAILGTP